MTTKLRLTLAVLAIAVPVAGGVGFVVGRETAPEPDCGTAYLGTYQPEDVEMSEAYAVDLDCD